LSQSRLTTSPDHRLPFFSIHDRAGDNIAANVEMTLRILEELDHPTDSLPSMSPTARREIYQSLQQHLMTWELCNTLWGALPVNCTLLLRSVGVRCGVLTVWPAQTLERTPRGYSDGDSSQFGSSTLFSQAMTTRKSQLPHQSYLRPITRCRRFSLPCPRFALKTLFKPLCPFGKTNWQ
jgi:hypothetical protein